MNRLRTSVFIVLLIACQVVAVSTGRNHKAISGRSGGLGIRSIATQNQAGMKTESASLKAGQVLLRNKGLPFDMDALTAPNWREDLAQTLSQLPEMQSVRYESEPLDGVVIADTLYLPENVQIAGDTLILAKHLVFEGSNAAIRGNHNLYILPVNTVRVIGTTLAAVNKSLNATKNSLPPWTDIEPFVERRDSSKTSLTIDTSWYPNTKAAKAPKGLKPSFLHIMEDASGGPGSPGAIGASGPGGWNGGLGGQGYPGNCVGQASGGPGIAGGNATDGYVGGTGGVGGPGGTGGDLHLSLERGDRGTYELISCGGPGGPGGTGGPGGNGGSGGAGGYGGNGADCQCSQGGQGSGGNGGPGGWGGRGGTGGTGGTGGRGGNSGHISVNYQCELTASVAVAYSAGDGGEPGYGGPHGYGGLGGQGGLGGDKGGGECPICPNEETVRGCDASNGSTLGNGQDGYPGQWGTEGTSYEAEFVGFGVDCDGGGGGGGGGGGEGGPGCQDYWQCWDVYQCIRIEDKPDPASTATHVTPQYLECWYWFTYCDYLGCW